MAAPINISYHVLEQAAEWFARLNCGAATAVDRDRWEAWIGASAEHREAWGHVERISRRFAPIQNSPGRRAAVAAYRQAGNAPVKRRLVLGGIVALAGAGLLDQAVRHRMPLPTMIQAWTADHQTGVGEVRDMLLADGSHVWLNTDSAFNEDYRTDLRLLRLVAGEMLIETGTDPGRPFIVETPHGRLRALGTRFTVWLDEEDSFVAVHEGAVEIRTASTGAGTIVRAGQQTRFTASAMAALVPADPAREAWTRGILIARNIPLSDMVRELRRHHRGHLGLAPEIAGLRVFGSYPANDLDQTLAMLSSVIPINVHRPLPWWTSIGPA